MSETFDTDRTLPQDGSSTKLDVLKAILMKLGTVNQKAFVYDTLYDWKKATEYKLDPRWIADAAAAAAAGDPEPKRRLTQKAKSRRSQRVLAAVKNARLHVRKLQAPTPAGPTPTPTGGNVMGSGTPYEDWTVDLIENGETKVGVKLGQFSANGSILDPNFETVMDDAAANDVQKRGEIMKLLSCVFIVALTTMVGF